MSVSNRQLKWYTYVGDFINTLKAFIGTNYQSLPFAFANSGLGFGLAGVFVIATLTDHCIQIMLNCKNILIEQICDKSLAVKSVHSGDIPHLKERLQQSVGYGDLGQRVYGSWCLHTIQFAVWFTQFSTCISYFIFIGNTIYEMFPVVPVNSNGSMVEQPLSMTDLNISVSGNELYRSQMSMPTVFSDDITSNVSPNSTVIYQSTAPDLRIIILWSVPVFLLTSLVRKVRYLAPMSFVAAIGLTLGIIAVLAFIIQDFKIGPFVWYRFATLPIFLTQMVSAYEGIGCILPIHSSMVGCRHMLRYYIHVNVYVIFLILCAFGTLGYLRYGPDVHQLLVQEIKQHTVTSLLVDATLIVSVVFTYPLQCYPVIETMESYILTSVSPYSEVAHVFDVMGFSCRKKRTHRMEYDEISSGTPPPNYFAVTEGSPLLIEGVAVELTASQMSTTATLASLTTKVPEKAKMNFPTTGSAVTVATWKRNVVRITLTLVIAAIAVFCRNNVAYVSAFAGAIGCSLLSFILPCLIDLKLRGETMSTLQIVKDVAIVVAAVAVSVAGLVTIVIQISEGRLPS